MSRYRRNSRGPRLLAPSAMLSAAPYAARLHWSPSAKRSSDGSLRIALTERSTSVFASRQARRSRKSPIRVRYERLRAQREPFLRADDQTSAHLQRSVVASLYCFMRSCRRATSSDVLVFQQLQELLRRSDPGQLPRHVGLLGELSDLAEHGQVLVRDLEGRSDDQEEVIDRLAVDRVEVDPLELPA